MSTLQHGIEQRSIRCGGAGSECASGMASAQIISRADLGELVRLQAHAKNGVGTGGGGARRGADFAESTRKSRAEAKAQAEHQRIPLRLRQQVSVSYPEPERQSGSSTEGENLKFFTSALVRKVVGISLFFFLFLLIGIGFSFIMQGPRDQLLLQQGRQYLHTKQYAFAVDSLVRAAQLNPKDAQIQSALAMAYLGVDEPAKAWSYANASLKTGAASDDSFNSELARYFTRHKDFAKAVSLLKVSVSRQIPNATVQLSETYARWAEDAASREDLSMAEKCWKQAESLKPGLSNKMAASLAVLRHRLGSAQKTTHKI